MHVLRQSLRGSWKHRRGKWPTVWGSYLVFGDGGNLDQIIDHIGEFIKEEMSKNWVVIV